MFACTALCRMFDSTWTSHTNVHMVCTWVDCLLFQIQLQSKVCIVSNILKCVHCMIFTASIKQLSIFFKNCSFHMSRAILLSCADIYHMLDPWCRSCHSWDWSCHRSSSIGLCGVCESGDTRRTMGSNTFGRLWWCVGCGIESFEQIIGLGMLLLKTLS